MNFIDNQLSFGNDIIHAFFKRFGMSVSSIWENSFIEFHNLLTNTFFSASQKKLKKCQDPQRLSGRDADKQAYAIVRPHGKSWEGGITRLPAAFKSAVSTRFNREESNRKSRQTEDELTRNMLASTASFINCVGGTNGDNPTELTRSDVDVIIRTLADNNAYTIADNIEGEDRFGTAPVRDAYFALGSTQLIGDLEQVNGFIAKAQYPSQMSTLRPEWGSVSNLRFLLSSIGSVSTAGSNNGNDVYNVFCVGMEAYAVVEQDGYSAQFIYRPPIYDGPLALNASVGYKFAQVPRITNDAWVLNLRTTLSV